jgi:hypothetical protein
MLWFLPVSCLQCSIHWLKAANTWETQCADQTSSTKPAGDGEANSEVLETQCGHSSSEVCTTELHHTKSHMCKGQGFEHGC